MKNYRELIIKKNEPELIDAEEIETIKNDKFSEEKIIIPSEPSKLKKRVVKDNKLKCSFCSSHFANRSLLIEHIDNIHRGLRYKCSECGIIFIRAYDCRRHSKKCKNSKVENIKIDVSQSETQTVEKAAKNLYKCPSCPMMFKSKNGRGQHIKIHHLKIRFKCDICSKIVTSKPNCMRHLLEMHGVTTEKFEKIENNAVSGSQIEDISK